MGLVCTENLYIVKEELYRMGNATSPRLSKVRSKEITTIETNGIEIIVANGNGVSVFNREGLDRCPLVGWVWEISKGTPFPPGLKLVQDGSFDHHMIVPTQNMPLSKYIGLLEQMAIHCKKAFKKLA
ncbi:hypothetical protein BTA51_26230 [Hahella sp. CCB-MM4]|nr:hypothetical protein BTA51_26230 [Hahella sp. CCB-MM4]